jgi:hypothetical protein
LGISRAAPSCHGHRTVGGAQINPDQHVLEPVSRNIRITPAMVLPPPRVASNRNMHDFCADCLTGGGRSHRGDERIFSTARVIWALALPAMLTNVATALFGMADMWVIGRLGDAGA